MVLQIEVDGERYHKNMILSRPNDLMTGSVAADGRRITPGQAALGQQGGKGSWIRSPNYHGRIGKGKSTHGDFGVVHNPRFNAPNVEIYCSSKTVFYSQLLNPNQIRLI